MMIPISHLHFMKNENWQATVQSYSSFHQRICRCIGFLPVKQFNNVPDTICTFAMLISSCLATRIYIYTYTYPLSNNHKLSNAEEDAEVSQSPKKHASFHCCGKRSECSNTVHYDSFARSRS